MTGKKGGLNRSIRSSQLISPYGAGAIYDFGDESFVIKSTEHWPKKSTEIRLTRLEQKLGVRSFKKPLEIDEKDIRSGKNRFNSIEMMRFPSWLFCPSCRKMLQWRYEMEKTDEPPYCNVCAHRSRLAPMRFVTVCSDGHLADVPWDIWAHSARTTDCRSKDSMFFTSTHSAGGGLASLSVRCGQCDAERDLSDIKSPNALRSIGLSCLGKHPWQRRENAESCEQAPIVVQRGASNAYFSEVEMALDISMDNEEMSELQLRILSHPDWDRLVRAHQEGKASKISIYTEDIVEDESCEVHDVEGLYLTSSQDSSSSEKTLKEEEWEALMLSDGVSATRSRTFVARSIGLSESGGDGSFSSQSSELFLSLVSRVVLIDRLRVVKANVGFRRDKSDGRRLAPNLRESSSWLPAVEVFGEGIFISLDESAVCAWEKALPNDVMSRMIKAHAGSYLVDRLSVPTPRFLLVHTLAHLLIRQLCFECGYSASSLAERLYVSEGGMAGLLIYTASGDSEGALGGLVRQGESDRFWPVFQNSLLRGQWCSADPVCRESAGQGVEGLNKAACHACALASETSCESMNLLLDRNMLFGSAGYSGYFEKLAQLIEAEIL